MKWIAVLSLAGCLGACQRSSSKTVNPLDDLKLGSSPNDDSPLGINLGAFGSITSEWIATDFMVQAEDWQAIPCGSGPSAATAPGTGNHTLDAKGWISSLPDSLSCVGTRLLQGAKGYYPPGRYLIRSEGQGTLRIAGDSAIVTQLEPGLFSFEVTNPTAAGILLEISNVAAGDPVRNIQVLAPGGVCGSSLGQLDPFSYCQSARGGAGFCAAGLQCFDFADVTINPYKDAELQAYNMLVQRGEKIYFHPLFLRSLRDYRALGLSRWLFPKDKAVLEPAHLGTHLGHFSEKSGAPWKVAVALSNLLKADLWLSLPVDITDELISELTKQLNLYLYPGLRVYADYGGEFWTPGSWARTYLESQATNGFSLEASYVRRAKEVATGWSDGFEGASARVHFVQTVDAMDPTMPERLQANLEGDIYYASLATSARFDLPAIAPLDVDSFSGFFEAVGGGNSVTVSDSELGRSEQRTQTLVRVASRLNVSLLAYGMGPTLTSSLTANDQRELARDDNRMNAMMTRHANAWKTAGGRLAMIDRSVDIASPSTLFPWGVRRYQEDYESVIAKAIASFLESTPCWWQNCEERPGG